MAEPEAVEPQSEQSDNPQTVKNPIARYVAEIELYDRETANWKKQSKRIIKRYKDDRGKQDSVKTGARFNVLWANTQTMKPSLYARNPKPDIQRRFKDNDPVGRVVSDILERCASYFCETDQFYDAFSQAVTDYMLPGRGTVWARYVPHFEQMDTPANDAGEITDDAAADAEVPEELTYEEALTDYVHTRDFGHNICRTWDEVWLGWRIVYLSRAESVRRFGKIGKVIPLDYALRDLDGKLSGGGFNKSSVYECWDKNKKQAVWLHKDMPEALDVRPDPLKLDGFFPFPKPLFANLANDSLIPTPEYVEYQDQALELDDLTSRIASITKSLKVAGVYDASAPGIGRLLNEGVENKLIPVETWSSFNEKGGLEGAVQFLPLKDVATALLALYQARDKVKEDLHEISGIPDIVRGESDAGETLGAQEIKTSFAVNRISDKQREVQRFVRAQIRLVVDIICGHFQIETIKKISGVRLFTQAEKQAYSPQPLPSVQPGQQQMALPQSAPPPLPPGVTPEQFEQMMIDPAWEEVEALIRNDAMRCFRIDIETDSTIKADEEQEKQSRIEFVKVIGEYMSNALPAGQAHPELVPFLLEGLQFLARAFPVGKNMESALDAAVQKLEKAAANPQPKPDPDMIKVQGQLQLQQAEMQGKQQMAQQQMQMDAQAAQAKAQADAESEQVKARAQVAVQQHLNELENQRELQKQAAEQQIAREKMAMEGQIEIQKAHIMAAASIEVARINAKSDDGAAAEAREASGE